MYKGLLNYSVAFLHKNNNYLFHLEVNMKHEDILKKMTLEEKASLLSGKNFWETMDYPEYGIPGMFLSDGPHGLRKQAASADQLGLNPSLPATCFPTASALANTWNPDLVNKVGNALGKEAVKLHVNMVLGPGINIKRSPRCGRNFEYFSEDPYLAGKLAAGMINGIQSNGISACVKHYCANSQETRRINMDSIIDLRALREIYTTAFEIAIKEANPLALMSSYNMVNGYYVNENKYLEVDVSTYSDYELARRTPDIKGLRKLAELYGLNDELLGARLPIVARTVYPEDVLLQLERAIATCPERAGNYLQDKKAYDMLKAALDPVLEIRNNALDLPNIDLKKYTTPFSNQTIKTVELDMRAEKLIIECIEKQNDLLDW